MRRIRSRDTKPELVVRRLLHSMGYRYRLCRKDLPGCPDIVLPKYKTVIFVHGCFWHRHACPRGRSSPSIRQDFWLTKFRDTVQRDRRNTVYLRQAGWNVVIVWECQTRDLDRLRLQLSATLQ